MEYLDNLLFGLILSSIIAVLAYRRGSLDASGALGAVIVGTLIFGFGGWVWGLTLITFFVSSSALSHYNESDTQIALLQNHRTSLQFLHGHPNRRKLSERAI